MLPYEDLKKITDTEYKIGGTGWAENTIRLLEKCGIKQRGKDGKLVQINISHPTTIDNAMVVGYRYIKNNGTFTEDTFLFKKDNPKPEKFYKGKLEEYLKEYIGTHKKQL